MGIRAILLCVLIVVAGCTVPFTSDRPERSPARAGTEFTYTAHLHLFSQVPFDVTVTELGQDARGVVVDETHDGASSVEYDGSGSVFRGGMDYRVVVRVNGTVRWNETVFDYEYYDLHVASNGTVTVRTHGEA